MSGYAHLTSDLLRMNHRFHRMYHGQMPQNISRLEYFLLTILKEAKQEGCELTVSDLARTMEVSNPAISRKLREMTEQQYVERYDNPNNRRNTYIRIAPQGEALLDRANEVTRRFTQAALEHVSEHEVEEFIRIGNLLADAMQQLLTYEMKGE